ncbi:hypothetical protein MTO96_039832 [Rhipicephalus appendiculatus]
MARLTSFLNFVWITLTVLCFAVGFSQIYEEAMQKSCKPGETYTCASGTPACRENTCDAERQRGPCTLDCLNGCWCRGKMYRRKRDNKCVPKHECLL